MTAPEALLSFRQIAPLIGFKTMSWVHMLIIASHGPTGCAACRLSSRRCNFTRSLRNWQEKGLVTLSMKPGKTRPRLWVTITPLGQQKLNVTPP